MDSPITLGIVTTHPIQYQAPLFRELADRERLEVVVFFRRLPDPEKQGEGFGTAFSWDLPLLDGYTWRVLASGDSGNTKAPTFATFGEAYQAVDVMLIHGWQSPYMWRAWARGLFANTPLLVRGESNAMRSRPLPIQLVHRLYLKPFQRYLYIGESNKQFYREAGVSEDVLYPARYCIENERFDADRKQLQTQRDKLRRDLGIASDAVCFIFCGKFTAVKRTRDIALAFRRVSERTDWAVHLLMVGDGALRKEAEEVLAGLEDTTTFTGFMNQTEISQAYTAADVMVLASDWETWGLVVNEGMVFQLPAIVSDRVGGGPDLIKDRETGYIFPFGNVDVLADKMIRLAKSPKRARKMGEAARDLVLSTYGVKHAADGIEKAAQDISDLHKVK